MGSIEMHPTASGISNPLTPSEIAAENIQLRNHLDAAERKIAVQQRALEAVRDWNALPPEEQGEFPSAQVDAALGGK